MKKLISSILCLAMILSLLPANAADAEDYKYAEYVFEEYEDKSANITQYWLSDSSGGGNGITTTHGKRGVKVGNFGTFRFMNLNITDKYWYSEEPDTVKFTIEYFDEGSSNSYFYIRYGNPNTRYAESEKVHMTGTNEWKTAEIIVDDMIVANRDDMADFKVATWCASLGHSETSVLFHSVRIEQCFPVKPMKSNITSKEPGNILNYKNDEKTVNFEFENITEYDGTAQVAYIITDENENIISEGKIDTLKVAALSKTTVPIETKAQKCGLYRIDYKFSGEVPHNGKVTEFSIDDYGLFSIAQTWQEGDEKNRYSWVCAHLDQYRPYQDPLKTMRAIDLGGFGGARADGMVNRWMGADALAGSPTDGIFGFNWDSNYYNTFDLSHFVYAGFGHTKLYVEETPSRNDQMYMPHTERQVKSYADFCAALAKEWDSTGMKNPLRLEVWNEPNNAVFNLDLASEDTEYYANLLKRVYTAVKEVSPRTIVVGMVTVGSAVGWVKEVLDYGGYDYVDEVCIHPYTWNNGSAKFDKIINDTKEIHNYMETKFGKAKPIVYSEIGWHDTGIENEDGTGNSGTTYGVTSMQQARNSVILLTVANVYDLTDVVCWYDLQNDGDVPTNSEHNFGMLESPYHRQAYAAKPAFLATCAYNKLIPNGEFISKIEINGVNTGAYNFKRTDGTNAAIMWTFEENETMVIDLGTKSIETYDFYGNPTGMLTSESGIYTFNLTGEPRYITGKFEKFEKAEDIFKFNDFSESVPDDLIPVEITDTLGRNLSVDVTPRDSKLSVEGDTAMINGKSSFSLKSDISSLGRHYISVKIYDENGVYYNGDFTILIRTPFKFELKTKQLFEDNLNRWQAVISVTNNAYTTPMTGKIEITEDSKCKKVANVVNFIDLRPKEERTFYINLPEMVAKRTLDISAKTTLDTGYSEEYKGTVDFTTAHYVYNKPEIDGVIEENEWNGFWVTSDRLENIEGNLNGVSFVDSWGGTDDLSVKAKFGWDEENFYMLAVVKDNVFYNNESVSNQWAADNIQYGFEDINDKGGNQTSNFTESGIALIGGRPQTYRWSTLYSDISVGAYDNFDAKIVRNEETKETIYEMAIPWSEIFYPDYDITNNIQLGFSMMVNDSDGTGRRGWIKYNGGIGNVKDAKEFGTMILIK